MTTYTSLLSGDPYIAEDWTATIRANHSDDLPGLNKLRKMIRDRLDSDNPVFRSRVMESYNYLVKSVSLTQSSFNKADRQLLNNVVNVFREELRK